MIEKEERILRQDTDEINKNAETLQEMKIYNAMRGGIMRGKKREKKHIYSLGIGAVVAVAAAVLLTFSFIELPVNEVAEHSVQTASTKNWDDFKEYRLSSSLDPALASALEQNLVKPVRQSAENNGYRVDVTGAVTDGRQVFVLYSVQNNTDKEATHADFSLQFGDIQDPYPHKGASLSMLPSESRIPAGQSVDFIYSTKLTPSVQYSKNVNFNVILTENSEEALMSSSSKYRTSLDVAFEIDPDMFKDLKHTLVPDRILTVDGQKISVHQVLYTPLSTYVDLEYNENNDKRIFQLINPVLISKSGDITEKLYYPGILTSDNSQVYSDDSKVTLVFKNSQYKQPDSVSLKTFGISAVAKDQMKIVVDLNKKQILSAPGNNLELVEPVPEYAEAGEILLRQKIENAQWLKTYTRFADTFTDAQGQVHDNNRVNKTTSGGNFGGYSSSKEGTAVNELRYRFGEKAKDYPQPLTITIEKYMNPIMDTQAVELYTKN